MIFTTRTKKWKKNLLFQTEKDSKNQWKCMESLKLTRASSVAQCVTISVLVYCCFLPFFIASVALVVCYESKLSFILSIHLLVTHRRIYIKWTFTQKYFCRTAPENRRNVSRWTRRRRRRDWMNLWINGIRKTHLKIPYAISLHTKKDALLVMWMFTKVYLLYVG